MITPTASKLLIWSIRYASYLHVVPYYWDTKKGKIRMVRNKFRLLIWFGTSISIFVYIFIISIRLLRLLPMNKENYMPIFLHIFTIVCFIIPCALYITLYSNLNSITSFLNHYVRYFKYFEERFIVKEETGAKSTPKSTGSEKLMKLISVAALFHPILIETFILHYFTKPHRRKYFTDVIPFLPASEELAIFIGMIQLPLFYYLWAIIMFSFFTALIYIDLLLLIFEELKPNKTSELTKISLREPGAALFTYRCFQILHNEGNNITRALLLPTLQIVCMTLNVMTNFLCIRHYDDLGLGFISNALISAATTVYQVLLYYKLGQIYEYASGFCKAWKRKDGMSLKNKKILNKYLKSCRPLRCEIGDFDFYKKLTSFIIMGKVLFYTGKMLLMLKFKSA